LQMLQAHGGRDDHRRKPRTLQHLIRPNHQLEHLTVRESLQDEPAVVLAQDPPASVRAAHLHLICALRPDPTIEPYFPRRRGPGGDHHGHGFAVEGYRRWITLSYNQFSATTHQCELSRPRYVGDPSIEFGFQFEREE